MQIKKEQGEQGGSREIKMSKSKCFHGNCNITVDKSNIPYFSVEVFCHGITAV